MLLKYANVVTKRAFKQRRDGEDERTKSESVITKSGQEQRREHNTQHRRDTANSHSRRVIAGAAAGRLGARRSRARATAGGFPTTRARGGGRRRGLPGSSDAGEGGVEDRAGVLDTLGAGGDLGLVGHRRDGAERFRWLAVGHDLAVLGVDTGEVLVLALARLEGTVLGVVRRVVGTSNAVELVLAEFGVVRMVGVASFDTEGIAPHEVVPLNDLVVLVGVTSEGIGVDETAHGVTTKVSTVRVHLTSPVTGTDVDLGLVNETDDLDVGTSLHELDTLEGIARDQAGATPGLGTPSNHLAFVVGDDGVGVRRSPEAEVINRVDDGRLAAGRLAFRGRVASVVTVLDTADEANVSVGLVRKAVGVVREAELGEGSFREP